MSDTERKPDLEAWKITRADGSWETYWRAGYVVEGQDPIIVEQWCRNGKVALTLAENAAKEHHKRLEDVGMFMEVKAFTQRWKTRQRGNLDEFDEATFSTRILLRPRTDMTPAEAILRARQRRQAESGVEVP